MHRSYFSNCRALPISRMSLGGESAAKVMTHDEARRIAVNIAKPPGSPLCR
jgi:hypothetical protein